jgi:anhydro-N-acetylmuramic acid kinase
MDAVLTEIAGSGLKTRVRTLAFVSLPYSDGERSAILRLASGDSGGSRELTQFHFWLGHRSLEACLAVCEKADVAPHTVDLVGSHGQTLWHLPQAEPYLGLPVRGTLQLGEASVICEGLGCPVVSDFRVRDLAAGGQGAPLVPYAEYLLYRRETETVGLQNLGGIGNLTILPAGGAPEDTFAFDTGPGNMVIDQLTERLTGGARRFDANGEMAAAGHVSEPLLAWMMQDPYLKADPPKTTGREAYGAGYVNRLMRVAEENSLRPEDILATATRFPAVCVRIALENYRSAKPDLLVVGGGGCRNTTLMQNLRQELPVPVWTNEDLGLDSDAKEAVAFAVLANECIHGRSNNLCAVTGAAHPVVMGKISL